MMGEAFVAVADDGNAIYWNPAGLARLQRTQVSLGYANLFGLDITNYYGGFLRRFFPIPLPFGIDLRDYLAFGVNYSSIGTTEGPDNDQLKFHNDQFHFALAFQLPQNLSYLSHLNLGINFKSLKISGELDGTQVAKISGKGWDVGMLYELSALPYLPQGLNFGLTVRDAGANKFHPEKVTWGLSYRPFEDWPWEGHVPISDPLLAIDVDDRTHVGLEFWLARILALRAGWQKDRHTKENAILSFGFGFKTDPSNWSKESEGGDLQKIIFDVALPDGRAVGSDPQFGFSAIINEDPRLIRIEGAHIDDVFASLYMHYNLPGSRLGSIKLRNVSKDTLKTWIDFEEDFYIQQQTADTVFIAGQSTVDFPLRIVFKPVLFNASKGRRTVKVKVAYERKNYTFYDRNKFASRDSSAYAKPALSQDRIPSKKKAPTLRTNQYVTKAAVDFAIYGKHDLIWDNPGKAAAFITDDDTLVQAFVVKARANKFKFADSIQTQWFSRYENVIAAMNIFNAVQSYGVDYHRDPVTPADTSRKSRYRRDTVKYPADLLSIPEKAERGGDCDDLSVLYASLLQNDGIETALVSGPGHVFMMFDSGIPKSALRTLPLAPDRFDTLRGRPTLWIPIESTMLPDSSQDGIVWNFGTAWDYAADRLARAAHDSVWKKYVVPIYQGQYPPAPPAVLKSSGQIKIPDVTPAWTKSLAALAKMKKDYLQMKKDSLSLTLSLKEEARIRNEYGILLAQNKNLRAADSMFSKILLEFKKDSSYCAQAFNNLGNVEFIRGNFARARSLYEKALKYTIDGHANIYLNLGLLYQMMKIGALPRDTTAYQKESMKAIQAAATFYGGNEAKAYAALRFPTQNLAADVKAGIIGDITGWTGATVKKTKDFIDRCFKRYLGKRQVEAESLDRQGTKGDKTPDAERGDLVWWSY